jgi:hypothetical protein
MRSVLVPALVWAGSRLLLWALRLAMVGSITERRGPALAVVGVDAAAIRRVVAGEAERSEFERQRSNLARATKACTQLAFARIAGWCEFEAGRCRYNANPAALGSFWEGYDAAMKATADHARAQSEATEAA